MSDTKQGPKPVRVDCEPLVIYEAAGMDCGWAVWIERVTFADGTATEEFRSAAPPPTWAPR